MSAQASGQIIGNLNDQPGRILGTMDRTRKPKAKPHTTGSQIPSQEQTMNTVKYHVVKVVHSAPGHSQKREINPGSAACYSQRNNKLKYVKGVSCVTQLSCVKPVTNVKNAASNLPVGARLQNYWQTWLNLGAGLKIVQILTGLHPSLSDPAKSH